MKQKLIKFCGSMDIDYVGIAPPGPYTDIENKYGKKHEGDSTNRLNSDILDKMIYPELTLKDVKSVIVCLFPYYIGSIPGANLSKYAYSTDYHMIAQRKLHEIGVFLERQIENFNYKCFADNGPLNDRYMAHKAGLGVWGINNHIITERYGSYVFIGYIINNYQFEADTPLDRTCIKCYNCVRDCPGQCIRGDFTIDSTRCKSYITQKKGQLTVEEIATLRKNCLIWGCDVCQDVCPHNKGVQKTPIEDFKNNIKHNIEYWELANMSNREFLKHYKDRAFAWRGKGVLKRNYEILYENRK